MAKLISIAPLKSAPLLKRPSTHHATTRNFKKKVFTRVGSAQRRQKSGNESTHETSPQKAFDVFTRENHSAAEVIAERSMLQATESRMKGTSRDKESLLDECLALKNALANQRYHLQLHKVHHELVNVEQRKIEIQMGELEVAHGLKAPRTGDLSQLKARYLGLKCRQQEYFTTLTTLQDDLDVLKKDPRVSFTQEAMAQRDIFASETRRLQKIIHKLQICHLRVVEENNKVAHLCENIAKLTCKINSIEKSMKDKKSTIEQMRKDIDKAKTDAIEAQNNTKNAVQKTGELENHSHVLQTMLIREKEEASRIQKQTSMMNEQIRIIRKNNSDRALQAQIAAGMDLAPSVGKGGRKARKVAKLKDQSESDDTSPSSPAKKDLTSVRSSPSSPATPSCPNVGKDFDEIRANYFRAIGSGTNTFVEGAPRSGSPKAKIHPDLGSPSGDHSNYEQLQTSFVIDVTKAEDEFTAMMEKFEYGATRPKRDLEAEAASLRGELEALKKSQVDVKKWLENLTIELDDQTLKANEYIVDVKDTKTNVRITSPDKTPEALARKKTEEEARRKKAAEDAERRVAEEATRRAAEEVTRRAAEEATRRAVEETTRRLAEEAARRAAEEAARRAPKEAATRAAEEITRRLAEEAARRAAEEPARRAVGETTRRFAEEAARRATEEAARRAAEEATTRAVEETTRGFAEEAARQAAEEAAKRTAEEAAKRTAEEATTRAVEETTRRLAKEAARRAAEEAARRATEEAATQADEETTRLLAEKAARQVAEEAQRKTAEDEEAARRIAEEKRRATEATKRKKEAEDEAARKRAAEETAGKSTSSTPSPKGKEPAAEEFFDEKMQGTIKENIKDVLKHLETISETVQQKATTGGTAEQSAKDALKKFD